tara:strand:+ start:6976 stop:7815 length:840 start_codon:yes stop_codon:yes gene_type:complete
MTTQEQENLGPYRGKYRSELEDDAQDEQATLEESETEDEVIDDETISVSTEVKTEEHDYKKRYDDLKKHYDSKLYEWKEEREQLMQGPQPIEEFPEEDADIANFKENYPDVYNVVEAMTTKNSAREVQELKQEIERLSAKEEQLQAKNAYQALLALHPDFSDIKKSDQFKEWLGKQPPSIADGIIKNNNDVQYASRVLDLYKADTASTKKTRGRPSKKQLEAAAEAVTRTSPVNVSTNNSDANKKVWTTSEIRKLKPHEFDKLEAELDQANAEGRIVNG